MHGDFTTKVKNDLAFAQSHGWTVVLRFAYIKQCPFNDATLAQMLRHIQKLNEYNVFKDYSVVIAAIQAGFIGRYGEWHYWDEHNPCPNRDFGEANGCSDTFGLNDTQWRARRQIIDALLNASPKSVDILVRVPFYKYHEFGKNPTTLDEDRAETDASRIGYHNDALLSDHQDQGTFKCPGDRTYMHEDTKYNFVIGETNDPTHHSEYACPKAMTDLKYFHYSSVHKDYEEHVIQYWKDHGCYNEIAARLGYRLYMKNAILPDTAKSGGQFCYKIVLRNVGYAAPFKQLQVKIALKSSSGSPHYMVIPNVDVRTWQPDTDITLSGSVTIPSGMQGTYKVYLVLAHKELSDNWRYNVLMANRNGVPQTSTRMNALLHSVTVTSGSCSGGSTGSGTSCHTMHLSDGSFESSTSGWSKYSQGFTVQSSSDAQDGSKYIRVENGAAEQTIDFSGSPVHEFRLSGYSRHSSDAHVSDPADYSIYCDLVDTDDNSLYGYTENFDTSTTPEVWHLKELHVVTSKSIKTATCYAMFRNGQGYVYFDNFRLNTCAGQSCRYQTADGSFEVGDGWVNYQDGFKRHQGHAQNGNYYITVTNGGATQYIDFNSGSITRFTLSGYSRANSVSGISGSDYSIYCDLTHPNHDNTWGEHADFDPSQSSWQHAVLNVVSPKVILGARCYAMFRNGHGSADFDNFQLESCE
ncbi:uncharacterized protein LOC132741543 [Ruditapes philippinarum]|uniref:uncharacterized protein LOC132741543 n=1 Tax=Ruditapes philippinarum TaxID=129788 RepID=UPI00295A963A|nr:uncharacterized protein LOC132741543 [Ruditapes philippinarum]